MTSRFSARTCSSLATLVLNVAAASAQWQTAPAFPTQGQARYYAAGVNQQGTLIVIGGMPFGPPPANNGPAHYLPAGGAQWQSATGIEGPIVRQCAGIDNLGRSIVFGGVNGIDPEQDPGVAYVYDLVEGQWNQIADRSPLAPDDYVACAVDDQQRVYSIGGGPGPAASAGNPNSAYVERYVGSSNVWQALTPMPNAVADAAATHDGRGHILVFGGYNADASARTANVAQYDIASNTWSDTAVPDMPVDLSGLRVVLGADERVYVLGGESGPVGTGTTQSTVYKLDLHTLTWSVGPSMTTARKHFAAVRGNDDYVHALGGDNDSGGTDQCEKLYTPTCPTITQSPESTHGWAGGAVSLTAAAAGGGTLVFQWRREGVDLVDGPSIGGGTISGATTPVLLIANIGLADAGTYDVVVTNDCGAATSDSATVTVQNPPTLDGPWTVTNLHPAWAAYSYGWAVSGDRQVGSAYWVTPPYNLLEHPIAWTGSATSAQDLTPPNSVGGGCRGVAGDTGVGWWWRPYSCYYNGQWQTCYFMAACQWTLSTGAYVDRHTGSEYSVLNDTDGSQHVGYYWWDDGSGNYYYRAFALSDPYVLFLHPDSVHNSFASAVEGGKQYGSIQTPFPFTNHAAMWSGTPASFIDLHPAGAGSSGISGVGDGQQVGGAQFAGVGHAGLWAGSAASFRDLHPAGASSSSLSAADGGLQVGSATVGGVGHAGAWLGSAESFLDLHPLLGPSFSASAASDVEVRADGSIVIIGHGFNATTDRYEALLWQFTPQMLGDLNCDGVVNFDDINPFVLALSNPAGYQAAYPDCDILNGDCNGDGVVTFDDINPFVALLAG